VREKMDMVLGVFFFVVGGKSDIFCDLQGDFWYVRM
jgi:hypothetical protein